MKENELNQNIKWKNNRGITLVELIIAVAILGIVVTPLLHAFITSARINSKARETLNETIAAENLMEEFNDATVDDLIVDYGGAEQLDGRIEFSKVDPSLLNVELGADIYVDITLDPTSYSSDNDDNLVDLEMITSSNCAIYSMPLAYDAQIYQIFADNSLAAHTAYPSTYVEKDETFFEENLDRIIYVSIVKSGETLEGVPLVQVQMNMIYEYHGSVNCLATEDLKYTTQTKELFDNLDTGNALSGVFLMFLPRYLASTNGHLDEIRVLNFSNVETTAFIVRQETADDSLYLPGYAGARIYVYEDNINTPYTALTEGYLNLRTNMHENLTDLNDALNPANLNCIVSYRNQTGTQIASASDSEKILHVTTVDGRTLDNTSVRNRIYSMTIEIYKEELISGVLTKDVIRTMTGTKVD